MHVLLAKIIGRPAVENWNKHIADAEKSVSKLRALAANVGNHAARIDDAAKAFERDPNEKNLSIWIELEGRRTAAQAIAGRVRDLAAIARAAAVKDGGEEKMLAACAEVEAELDQKIAEIKAEDAARSERFGEEVSSPEPIRAIERLRKSLVEARRWRRLDLLQSAAQLDSVLSETS